MSTGSKRAWDGAVSDSDWQNKRPREEPRDWRDVHLKSPRRPAAGGSRRESTGGRRDDYGRDHRRASDHPRGHRRDDYRDYHERRDDSRKEELPYDSPTSAARRPLSRPSNGHAHKPLKDDSEKEEGE
jgi:serine/threonine-protein kinase PRP4